MRGVAVLGAGDLGGALARLLAEAELARRVTLVDADAGRAAGKALDIRQSGPVEGYDTEVVGAASLEEAGPIEALVVADPSDGSGAPASPGRAVDLVTSLLPAVGEGLLLAAGAHAASVVAAAVSRGLPRERALGSAPLAYQAALRRHLAEELGVQPREVAAGLLGLPPADLVLPRGSATVGGVPLDRLSPVAGRRALAAAQKRTPGPSSLAAAACRVLRALRASRPAVLPVLVWLGGEYGHRGAVVAVPARLGAGRLLGVVETELDPAERVAFDRAAERSRRL